MFKTNKIVLGVLSLLPLLFLTLYMLTFAGIFTNTVNIHRPENGPPEFMVSTFFSSVTVLGAFFLTTIGLLIYYLFHLACNPEFENDERFFWALAFLFIGSIAFPVYWYFKIKVQPRTQ